MGLFDAFKPKADGEFEIGNAMRPFYYTLSQYSEFFYDERLSYDDSIAIDFDYEFETVRVDFGAGSVEPIPSVRGVPACIEFSTIGDGLKYGELHDMFERLAQDWGWDSLWRFDCFYSDIKFLAPGYLTVQRSNEFPGLFIISAEKWFDNGGFRSPNLGTLALS